ncbi:glycoside hydrolase family 2 TIM barrel-domain containing protein [Bacteroides eggerthii]|uniref:beta-galactosidase n=1 Tax=Bacteroides eggerthii TaxID=28111 RepID=A0ABT7U9T9_9BACE|nr:glycoside hydrolase family 2 TIM barrel-domain containing protein [Bacteroides eggerthii]
MRKITFSFILCCMTLGSANAQQPLNGFLYGIESQPVGTEWEAPEKLSLNKEQPRAYFFSFGDVESAKKVHPEASKYWQDLNGTWKFHWAPNPGERPKNFYEAKFDAEDWDDIKVPSCWNVVGIQKDGSLKYGVPIYCNQPVIFKHTVAVGDWKGGVMREPNKDWTTYKYRNEVGSYRRTFTVSEDWKDREVYINFDGVNSFFYLWINGKYVGFSKNSRNTATFNITDYLVKGENVVAVEVYRNSDGSFLEAQDMFRLPGIFRDTYLTSTAKVEVRDMKINTDLTANGASVEVNAKLRNLGKKAAKGYTLNYSVYENKLYSDDIVGQVGQPVASESFTLEKDDNKAISTKFNIENAKLWSAEQPNRYTLVVELKDKKGKTVDVVSSYFGVCKVEIKDTKAEDDEFGLAGRYFYVNNKPVKLKGVNRQEINPNSGNSITHEQMEEEIMIMKRGNINHVRNSHYSCDPYWYYLCDKYGIYLEDEANLESHEYYYGDASLSHVPEFKDAHVARVMELVHAHVNHPSIVIWSLGNEGGPGDNFKAAYNAIKEFDLSRPVQYERNNDIVDMGSNQYPSIAWTREAVKGKYNMKYPFHISEYAHSMGNAGGNLEDYWEAMESTNFFCGAAIWDWVDQSLYNYDKTTGEKYLAYGGDFGDKPNDGMFCMNGILFPGHKPKPEYFEVKKVYQNVGVKAVDITKGQIEVFNKNYFEPMTDVEMVWSLWKDGKKIQESNAFKGPRNILGPREKGNYTIPFDYNSLDANSEYFVKVQFLLAKDMPWAKKGYVQMEEQLPVKSAAQFASIKESAKGDKPTLSQTKEKNLIKGNGFSVVFNNTTGTINSLQYGNKVIFADGNGPKLDAFRAMVDNDNWAYHQWFAKGLNNLQHKVLDSKVYTKEDGTVVLAYTVESQAPYGQNIRDLGISSGKYEITKSKDFGPDDFKFTTNQIWTVYPDGSIELEANINSNEPGLNLPRLGYVMKTPSDLKNYTYYGRGPQNNYNDRMNGAFVQLYNSTVQDQFVHFPKPQSMGNREDVRWCALTDEAGNGAQFISTTTFSASALPWSAMQMVEAPHPYQLPKSDGNYLHLDLKVMGLGGNSCGQGGPLEEDRIKAGNHSMGFIIRPVQKSYDMSERAKVSAAGDMPLGVARDRAGKVTISTEKKDAVICYTLNGNKKVQTYSEPINMRNGGTITVWEKSNDKLKTTMTFEKIETVPVEVMYASSVESGEGDPGHLVDNDPNTIWHTMYSVTVAKYPHWVDLDCGEVKTLKGFTYLPRQNGPNGNIKDYQIQVSNDGKTWGDVLVKGSFENNAKEKRVMFSKPVKARYVRFTALSSQNGQDFASGAEMGVLAE